MGRYAQDDEAFSFTAPRPPANDGYCDYSWLKEEHCAHCLGHYIDPDLEEAAKP